VAEVTAAVTMAATSSLVVIGTSHITTPPLVDQVLGVLGQDPALIGAMGYVDDMFTTRLAGDIN
jgi:hypothetical protein